MKTSVESTVMNNTTVEVNSNILKSTTETKDSNASVVVAVKFVGQTCKLERVNLNGNAFSVEIMTKMKNLSSVFVVENNKVEKKSNGGNGSEEKKVEGENNVTA